MADKLKREELKIQKEMQNCTHLVSGGQVGERNWRYFTKLYSFHQKNQDEMYFCFTYGVKQESP